MDNQNEPVDIKRLQAKLEELARILGFAHGLDFDTSRRVMVYKVAGDLRALSHLAFDLAGDVPKVAVGSGAG